MTIQLQLVSSRTKTLSCVPRRELQAGIYLHVVCFGALVEFVLPHSMHSCGYMWILNPEALIRAALAKVAAAKNALHGNSVQIPDSMSIENG